LPHQRDAGFIKPILTNWLGAFSQKFEAIHGTIKNPGILFFCFFNFLLAIFSRNVYNKGNNLPSVYRYHQVAVFYMTVWLNFPYIDAHRSFEKS